MLSRCFKTVSRAGSTFLSLTFLPFFFLYWVALVFITAMFLTKTHLYSREAGLTELSGCIRHCAGINSGFSCKMQTWCGSGKGEQGERPVYKNSFLSFSSLWHSTLNQRLDLSSISAILSLLTFCPLMGVLWNLIQKQDVLYCSFSQNTIKGHKQRKSLAVQCECWFLGPTWSSDSKSLEDMSWESVF